MFFGTFPSPGAIDIAFGASFSLTLISGTSFAKHVFAW